jgi:enoyl-CoA hydratase
MLSTATAAGRDASDEVHAVTTARSASGFVWTVILHRPHARNAVDGPTAAALQAAFIEFERDATARVAVLFGAGGTFCAGADLKAISAPDGVSRSNAVAPVVTDRTGERWLEAVDLQAGPMGPTRMQLSKPVIAAIEGHAVAGGLELACWADMRVAASTAVLGVFCRRWGVPLIDGGTVRLPRIVGHGRAMDMILTGRPVQAAEAHAMGLVDRVVPKGAARAAAEQLAEELSRFPQACLRADRQSAREQWGLGEVAALAREHDLGRAVLREAVAGARKFADGAGRGGSFAASSSAAKL